VLVQNQSVNDSHVLRFWVPAVVITPPDYQLPFFDDQDPNTDDPTVAQAADFNRVIDAASVSITAGARSEEAFVPTTGQVNFTLAATPSVVDDTEAYVNNLRYTYGVDFTVVGTTFTWLNTEFTLDGSDELVVVYFT